MPFFLQAGIPPQPTHARRDERERPDTELQLEA